MFLAQCHQQDVAGLSPSHERDITSSSENIYANGNLSPEGRMDVCCDDDIISVVTVTAYFVSIVVHGRCQQNKGILFSPVSGARTILEHPVV